MWLYCRILARIKYWLFLYPHGPWGLDYFAIADYMYYNEKRAKEIFLYMYGDET